MAVAAYLYGCCVNTMRGMADRGHVRVKRTPGRHRRIDRDSIEEISRDPGREVVLDIIRGIGA